MAQPSANHAVNHLPNGSLMQLTDQHARQGGFMNGRSTELADRAMDHRVHYVRPESGGPDAGYADGGHDNARMQMTGSDNVPAHYNRAFGAPVPYTGPSAEKEEMVMREEIRQAAGRSVGRGGTVRTDPIHDSEVRYLKSMKEQADLAKFDDYVETFINPRQPGNMKWLMEVYPDYVTRRLQQAHTDYEFALRNQMIDSWGINTFDDLHFKYLVDQKKLNGPHLATDVEAVDGSYTPGRHSFFNFMDPNPDDTDGTMHLPFSSARYGDRPSDKTAGWKINRKTRPLGYGNTYEKLASGMYTRAGNTYPTAADSSTGNEGQGATGVFADDLGRPQRFA